MTRLRWRIEHDYREMKQALGLAHFEGRTWRGWPSRHPCLRRARLLHPAATDSIPKRDGAGLSLYQAARERQLLLAVWTGTCLTCHRNTPERIST
ncbi:hypothetical protein [Streptomyces sp. NBRC 13847]